LLKKWLFEVKDPVSYIFKIHSAVPNLWKAVHKPLFSVSILSINLLKAINDGYQHPVFAP
jgi:hypothetical protein